MKKNLKLIIWYGVIIAVSFWGGCEVSQKKPVEILKETTDTITVVKKEIVVVEKEVPVEVTRTIYEPQIIYRDTSESGEVSNVYQDTSFIDLDFYLFYTAHVTGRLNSIDLGYFDNRPDSTEVQIIENTITNTKYIDPKGFYWGGQVNTSGNIIPGSSYMWKKNVVLGGYNLNRKEVTIGYFRKF